MKVLVVDDHDGVRAMLRRFLGDIGGCEVVGEATDGVEAVELALRLKPDVVVMDYAMPSMNGLDATERIKAELPHVDVFMYTSSEAPAEPEMLRRGAAAVFRKDQIAELVEALRNWG